MFPLDGMKFPGTSQELEGALLGSLSKVLDVPAGRKVVMVEGDRYPELERLRVDVSGAVVRVGEKVERPKLVGGTQSGIRVETLEIEARGVRAEQAAADLQLVGHAVRLDFGRDQGGQAMLVLAGARDGRIDAGAGRADLEALVLFGIRAATQKHGITIKETELKLSQSGEREVGLELRVKASKFLVSATMWVRGRLQVDEALNLRAFGLSCEGEGKIAQIAAGYIQPHLGRFEGRQIPLAGFSLEGLALRDLRVAVNDGVRVSAAFGS